MTPTEIEIHNDKIAEEVEGNLSDEPNKQFYTDEIMEIIKNCLEEIYIYDEEEEEENKFDPINNADNYWSYIPKYSEKLFVDEISSDLTKYLLPIFTYRQRIVKFININTNIDLTLDIKYSIPNVILVCFLYGTTLNYYYSDGERRISEIRQHQYKSSNCYRLIRGGLKFIYSSISDFRVGLVEDKRIIYDYHKNYSLEDDLLNIKLLNGTVVDEMKCISNEFPMVYPQYPGDVFREFYGNCGFYIELPYQLFVINEKKFSNMLHIRYYEAEKLKILKLNYTSIYNENKDLIDSGAVSEKGFDLNKKIGRYKLYLCDSPNLINRDRPDKPGDYFHEVIYPYIMNDNETYNKKIQAICLCENLEEILILYNIEENKIIGIHFLPPIHTCLTSSEGILEVPLIWEVSEEFIKDYVSFKLESEIIYEDITEKNVSNNIVVNSKLLIEEYCNEGTIYPIYYEKNKLLNLTI